MRIIVCLDGSEFARSALPVLREIADAADADVELLRVIDDEALEHGRPKPPDDAGVDVVGASGVDPTEALRERMERLSVYEQEAVRYRERMETQLVADASEEMARAAADVLGRTPEVTVLFAADAARAIIEHARAREASLIAMATHSRRPVTELLLGSVAHAVLSSGAKPVLLVHPTD